MKNKLIFIIPLLLIAFFMLLPEPDLSHDQTKSKLDPKTLIKQSESISTNFVIRNVRLYDGHKRYESVDVFVLNNKVHKIAESLPEQSQYPELSGTGQTLLPGLIDSHTHAYQNALSEALNFGITTELDMFTMPEFANAHQQKRELQSNLTSADLFSATILATAPGGHGTEYGFEIPVLDSVEQVDSFVNQRIQQGADYIKAVYNSKQATRQSSPSISYEILAALIQSAHQHNKLLVVHVDNLISARQAIGLDADGIIHSFLDQVVDDSFIQLMVDKKAFIIPTLAVQASVSQQSTGEQLMAIPDNLAYLSKTQRQQLKARFPDFGIPKEALQHPLQSVKLLAEAGVTILAGSDAPNPGTTHGLSLHAELEFLAKAGLSNEQILHSATGAVGNYFPIGTRGTLFQNSFASMILVDGNPFENISDTQKINRIWKNGVQFTRLSQDQLASNTRFTAGVINDFNQQIVQTIQGAGIAESTDQFAGGKSEVILSLAAEPLAPDNQYLKVNGEIKPGFMFPWSGFSYLLGKDQQTGIDLSAIKFLKFRAKGDPQTNKLSVLLFETGSFRPIQKDLDLTEKWIDYSIELSQLPNLDISNIANISIVRTQTTGRFEFMLDDLRFE